ncbi:MAG: hypothetical protein ACREUA_04535, partial [Burkholderiales bacterium]
GQSIFKDDCDRERYLDILKANKKRFGYRLYAYVLMGNHHLIEIGKIVRLFRGQVIFIFSFRGL